MKKLLALVMAMVLCLSFVGCAGGSSTAYSENDFIIYDKDGKVLERPTANNNEIYLSSVDGGMTNKQVAVGDDAIEALEKYDLCYGKSAYSIGDDSPELLTKDVDLDNLIKNEEQIAIILCFDKDYNSIDTMEMVETEVTPANMIGFLIENGKIEDFIILCNNFTQEQSSSEDEVEEVEQNSSKIEVTSSAVDFDEESVKKQLKVNTYSYSNDFWNYGFIEITNNSKYDLDISADVKFYDASGALIGAESDSEEAFQQGTSILFAFSPDEEFETIEYELSVKEVEYYECVVKDLSYESVTAKEKEIVTVTNNGTEAAEFVEGAMLFFNGDEVVDYDCTYFTDDDSELKAGKSITEEMDCYEKYDSYKFYLTGRRYD